jgi:hypothetical protein
MPDAPATSLEQVGTLNAARWIVRLFSFVFYPLCVPMLYDFFWNGMTSRSMFYFLFFCLGVAGMHVGWRLADTWVNTWVSASLAMLLAFSLLVRLLPALQERLFLFSWEVHVLTFLTLIGFLLLGSSRMVRPRPISLVPADPLL